MARRRAIAAVLDGFLGTFTSRYSDFDGYWLFGFLADGTLGQLRIDLLHEAELMEHGLAPREFTRYLAVRKFNEQVTKARFPRRWLRTADLVMTVEDASVTGSVNGVVCAGTMMRFEAQAVTDLARTYRRATSLFVAPHDPVVESRSLRAVT